MRPMKPLILFCLIAFAAVTMQGQQSVAKPADQSCRRFVQGFYDWYVPRILKSADTYEIVLKNKPGLFSPALIRMLREDLSAAKANSGEIDGLDFDPFLNSQDPSTKFSVTKTKVVGTKCSAEVHGITDGVNNEEVHPELTFENGAWRFVNFHYEQNSDLIAMLKSLRADRQKSPKAAGR